MSTALAILGIGLAFGLVLAAMGTVVALAFKAADAVSDNYGIAHFATYAAVLGCGGGAVGALIHLAIGTFQ